MNPVVALDIDGSLGDYHGHFLRFAEEWYGRPMPKPNEINPGLPLHRHMKTSKATYRQCKLAYRQGGLKRSMPAYQNAANMIRELRKDGVEVWIATTRPYLRLDNIDPDTRHWLRRNDIHKVDGIIYGEHKYRQLVRIVGVDRVAAVLEDLPEMCVQARQVGIGGVVLRDQPYNKHFGDVQLNFRVREITCRAYDLYQAQHQIKALVDIWRRKHQ